MEKIIICLEKIDSKYKTKTLDLKNIISTNLRKKSTFLIEDYFLMYCEESQEQIKQIDKEFYKKLNILHEAWVEDCNRVYDSYINNNKKSFVFKKKTSIYQSDKIHAYYNDLELTTKSISSIIKSMTIKISSLQIQEFLN